MQTTFEIVNGPSREDLFDGLRLFSEKRLVLFAVKKNEVERSLAAIVNSIQAEGENGQSWSLKLTVDEALISPDMFVVKEEVRESGVYSSKSFNFHEIRNMLENERDMGGGPVLRAFKISHPVLIEVHYSSRTRKGTITIN